MIPDKKKTEITQNRTCGQEDPAADHHGWSRILQVFFSGSCEGSINHHDPLNPVINSRNKAGYVLGGPCSIEGVSLDFHEISIEQWSKPLWHSIRLPHWDPNNGFFIPIKLGSMIP